jgi:predicted DNA-binding transcriptional regulator YafY
MILKEYSDADHVMRMGEITSKFKSLYGMTVDRRTIYGGIDLLLKLDYDIATYEETGKKGYYLREREFELPEARLIMDSLYSFSGISSKHTGDLVKKVQKTLSVYERHRYKNLVIAKPDMKTDNRQVFYNIELLDEAISDKVKVKFTYLEYGFDKKLKPRRPEKYLVNPYGLVCANEHYYLVCNYDAHENISHYRIDRIRDIEKCEEKIKRAPKGFNALDYTNKSIYMFGGETERVVLKCKNNILSDVIDKFGRNVGIMENEDDETFTARLDIAPAGLKFWAMQYLSCCEVLSPQWLRNEIIESIKGNEYQKV